MKSRGAGGRKATRADSIDLFGTAAQTLKEEHDRSLAEGKTEKQASAVYKRGLGKLWKSELDEMLQTLKSNTVLTTTAAYRNELRRRGLDDELTLSIVRPPKMPKRPDPSNIEMQLLSNTATWCLCHTGRIS
ncbi:hypothetical protein G3A56_25675 (plasmid) [Rhizobium oryzihabitans]|uniref:Uncharacterized protein n=1 Tax=Rhizobium oryzihabitans TaxID=2267833 RepID=A0A7L5BQM0_9HYPH|nr:hypothetical protein [Rhizobium oryzihabitans]QIB41249.1 hypothetical protein G3A56_25675 [Rhizobium oryzihabitans]